MGTFDQIMLLIAILSFLSIGMFLLYSLLEKLTLFFQHKKQRIGSINPGDKVFIKGYIDDNIKLHSPITQKKCAAWEINVSAGSSRSKETLLNLYSHENITITDQIDRISIIIPLYKPLNIATNQVLNSVLQISKKPSFQDNQTTFSQFRDKRTYDFLEEYNLKFLNYLGLRRQMTVIEKILVTGDKIFVWGEVIMDGNQKVIKAKFASDNLIMQIGTIVFLVIGLMSFVVGIWIYQEFFI